MVVHNTKLGSISTGRTWRDDYSVKEEKGFTKNEKGSDLNR